MAVTEKDAEMAILVKRLQKDAQTPQEIFVEALKQWREEDKELWATNFPPGYRERTAAHTLGEIYSTGKTGKEWGKEWLKSKGVGDSQEAREILPPLCALDAIFITDRVKDAINQVGVEKLVKKVNGIRAGYSQVQKESDWKKPGGSKSWKSKVVRVEDGGLAVTNCYQLQAPRQVLHEMQPKPHKSRTSFMIFSGLS